MRLVIKRAPLRSGISEGGSGEIHQSSNIAIQESRVFIVIICDNSIFYRLPA